MARLSDAAARIADAERIAELASALDAARRERDATARVAAKLTEDVARLTAALGIRETVHGMVVTTPKWQVKASTRATKHHGIVWLQFSDWHFAEVVEVELLNGINAYSARIGEQRLHRWTDNVTQVADIIGASYDLDGAVVAVNGDILTGWIHGIDRGPTDSRGLLKDLRHWAGRMAAAFGVLAERFGRVAIYVTVGNHGRLSDKWSSRHAVGENVEWLLGLTLQDWFADDPRVSVTVAESVDLLYPIYDLRVLQTHGNTGAGRGGSGIAGFWPRLNRLRLTKQSLYARQGGFDVLCAGHFHQLKMAAMGRDGFIVNGSGKGFDAYARDAGFDAEHAAQALSLVAPERGIVSHWPIFLEDRKAEGW